LHENGATILDCAGRSFVDDDQKVSELAPLCFTALVDEADLW
jgi:hypothetical protein